MADRSITGNKIGIGEVKSDNIGNEQITSAHLAKSINDMFDAVRKDIDALKPKINEVLTKAYPIGAIYCSTVSTNPNKLFGFGTWEYIEQGRVLLSQGDKYNAGSVGGAETHTLTVQEMPSHKHGGATGNGGAHTHTGTASEAGEHTHSADIKPYGRTGQKDVRLNNQDGIITGGIGSEIGAKVDIQPGGAHSHEVVINSSGAHSHDINAEGGGQAHSIMQPYLSVYMWKRVS